MEDSPDGVGQMALASNMPDTVGHISQPRQKGSHLLKALPGKADDMAPLRWEFRRRTSRDAAAAAT